MIGSFFYSLDTLIYVMKHTFFGLFRRDKKEDDFIDASEAYLKSTYPDQYTWEELKRKLIDVIKRQIKYDIKLNKTYVNVTTYSDFREKQILPEVADYFRSKNYKVDLHNDNDYSDTNVLIINWQNNKRDFKKS